MNEFNVIGDVAGQYDALIKLLAKMPNTAKPILVGDLIDRGPKSKGVLEWAMMKGSNVIILMGNHEHMCIDFVRNKQRYQTGIWAQNGGFQTLLSFNPSWADKKIGLPAIQERMMPYVEWMEQLPPIFWHSESGLIVSHAPLDDEFIRRNADSNSLDYPLESLIWNRIEPTKRWVNAKNMFCIHGHNARIQPKWYSDDRGRFGINIDTSKGKILTGIHYPSMELYQESYL